MTNNRILNTRISEELYKKVSTKAKKNRTTISNLIRNLVEDTLEIHEDIHDAVDKKIRKHLSETEQKKILGFQEINLNKNTKCDNCDKSLKASQVAYFAFFEDRNLKAILCAICKNKNSRLENNEPHENISNN